MKSFLQQFAPVPVLSSHLNKMSLLNGAQQNRHYEFPTPFVIFEVFNLVHAHPFQVRMSSHKIKNIAVCSRESDEDITQFLFSLLPLIRKHT